MSEQTALANVEEGHMNVARTLDEVSQDSNLPALNEKDMDGMLKSLAVSAGVQRIEEALTDEFIDEMVMPMQGKKIGFLTDRDDRGGYPRKTVKKCLIEAMFRGVGITGNQFNIISGNCYITKEGFEALCRNYPGVSNLDLHFDPPHSKGKGAIVEGHATLKMNGDDVRVPEDGKATFPIKNKGAGVDAILGKAKRKLYKRVYKYISGISYPDGDAQDVVEVDAEVVSETDDNDPIEGDVSLDSLSEGPDAEPKHAGSAEEQQAAEQESKQADDDLLDALKAQCSQADWGRGTTSAILNMFKSGEVPFSGEKPTLADVKAYMLDRPTREVLDLAGWGEKSLKDYWKCSDIDTFVDGGCRYILLPEDNQFTGDDVKYAVRIDTGNEQTGHFYMGRNNKTGDLVCNCASNDDVCVHIQTIRQRL